MGQFALEICFKRVMKQLNGSSIILTIKVIELCVLVDFCNLFCFGEFSGETGVVINDTMHGGLGCTWVSMLGKVVRKVGDGVQSSLLKCLHNVISKMDYIVALLKVRIKRLDTLVMCLQLEVLLKRALLQRMVAGGRILGGPSIVRLAASCGSPITLTGIGLQVSTHNRIGGCLKSWNRPNGCCRS